MLERLLKICETEQMDGCYFQRIYLESLNEEGERFIQKNGDTFVGKYFNIHHIEDAINELIFASQIKHQNICSFFGYFCLNKQVILVYEEPIGTLLNNIDNDIESVMDITEQIVEIIFHLHSLRIVHGNIEPSCFYIYKNRTVKLMFDSTSILLPSGENINVDFKMYGLNYRPIECCHNQVGFSSDIWALGCTIFNLLYRSNLFPEQSSEDDHISCLESWRRNVKNSSGNSVEVPQKWGNVENFSLNLLILKMFNYDRSARPCISKIKDEIKKIKDEKSSSPISTVSFINNEIEDQKLNCRYNIENITFRVRNEILTRLNENCYEFRCIVMIFYQYISLSSHFEELSFNISIFLGNRLIGKKRSVNCREKNRLIEYIRESSDPLFSINEYYDI